MDVQSLLSLCERCYDHAEIVAGPDGRDGATVATVGSAVAICFRGTLVHDDLISTFDWLNDFRADLVSAESFPGRVHAGFLDSLNSLWPAVFDALEHANDKAHPWTKKVIITGHSKGGACAILAAVRLAHLRPEIVTFGSPMCGDIAFAADYPDMVKVTRFENDFDVVPFAPPAELGYHAIGTAVTRLGLSIAEREAEIHRLLAQAFFRRDMRAMVSFNHSLDTGYAPWCKK